ncbi:MAG: outer membrane lipoprotein carrier protein LolA [Hyphomonas sp.]|uniref:LolA family protein n=1 Tax=Hyphomonas sp. TaxID=87 RepID=UPI00352931D7
MKIRLATLVAATALVAAPFAVAKQAGAAPAVTAPADAASTALTPAQRDTLLKEVAASMEKVKTASGRFEQLSPDFTVVTGRFALSRPGKVRFEYDDPSPLLIVSNGTTVAMQDSELETTDRVPLGSTPLALLLDDQLDFKTEAEIVDVIQTGDRVGVTLRDKSGEMDGTLTLIFAGAKRDLVGWRAVDGAGNMTSVELSDVQTGKKLSPRLFTVKDFEDE